jgi:hypothetical protein
MIPRALSLQGVIGIASSLLLLTLVLVKTGDVRHWRKQAAHFEHLYLLEQGAAARTIANYRAAVETARQADKANAERVAARQQIISERTTNDLEARLADARSRALRLQLESRAAAAAGGGRGTAPVPAARAAPGAVGRAAQKDGFSVSDRLIATEQAIQLDELIKWVNGQAGVSTSPEPDRQ